uniref:SH2 domain-containing protein n=1 Tax=Angiostrongylus cantonensis TaxID=6313 RepID=A0A158PCA5_ANGCA
MTGGHLSDQIWYWGNVDKYMVSEVLFLLQQIMQEQPEGTFMVRDASSPGDYTLTVRFGNNTKLVRIHVYKGRCGFALESLTHDSVVSLIDFYRTRSLKCYNAQLDVCLKYPLPRRKQSIRTVDPQNTPCVSPSLPTFNADWDLRLGLERLRICQTEVDRAARLFDAVHEEKILADQLHYEYTQAIVDLDRKVKQIEEALNTIQNCEEFNDESDLKRLQAFIANCKVMECSIKKLKEERDLVVDRRARVSKAIEDLNLASSHAKSRLVSCHNNRNQCYTELFKKGVPKVKLVSTIELSTGMLEKESMKASELLADIRLAWEPEQYLVNDSSKEAAAALILGTRNRVLEKTKGQIPTDGIFLIRPSASQINEISMRMGDVWDRIRAKVLRTFGDHGLLCEEHSVSGDGQTSSSFDFFRSLNSDYTELMGGSVPCPSCKGTGRIPKEMEETLVALIPLNDDRLKPKRTWFWVLIGISICFLIASGVIFMLVPRAVDLHSNKPAINIIHVTEHTILPPRIRFHFMNYLNISNANYYIVQVVNTSATIVSKFQPWSNEEIGSGLNTSVVSVAPLSTDRNLLMFNNSVTLTDVVAEYCQAPFSRVTSLYVNMQFDIVVTLVYFNHYEKVSLLTNQQVCCVPSGNCTST